MRRVRTIAGGLVSVLLCAALALSPFAAFAAPYEPAPDKHAAAMTGSMPCDVPCKGCSDRNPSLSCLAACMGLIAAIPSLSVANIQTALSHRMPAHAQNVLVGTQREPDTPPPKFVLA